MKTILVLAVLAMVGSAFATPEEIMADVRRISADREAQHERIMNTAKLETPRVPDDAIYGKGQDFTIVTLPDGKTATALTFH